MIKQFTKPAKTINEDTYFANENFAFVLDGATGLLKENITDKPSDAQWYVLKFKEILINLMQADTKSSLEQLVSKAIELVSKEYLGFEGAENIKSKPSSGLSLIRKKEGKLEYLLLGDCALIVLQKDGKMENLQMPELVRLDGENIDKMAKIAKEKNITVIEARDHINDDLLRVRLTQNTPQGYYVLSDDTSAPSHSLRGEINLEDIQSICLLTDGFSQTYDTFDMFDSPKKLLETLEKENPEDIYAKLWDMQEEDKDCNQKPRFKVRDDATCVYIKF